MGELWIRTPGLCAKDDDEAVSGRAWFATGDRARVAKGKLDVLPSSQ